MNPDTRVAVCCYQGDAHQVIELMPFIKHHGCPITILSPEDSQVLLPGLDCRQGGKRCYIGWDGVERMREHLRILLTYPEQFFYINDSDSFCVSPELPAYLYAEPDVVWSSVIPNGVVEQQPGFAPGMPHVAFHPPWFLSRTVIERLLWEYVKPNQYLPFIDYWMLEAAVHAGLQWKPFEMAMSVPTASHEPSYRQAHEAARKGALFFHSVKSGQTARSIAREHQAFLGNGGERA